MTSKRKSGPYMEYLFKPLISPNFSCIMFLIACVCRSLVKYATWIGMFSAIQVVLYIFVCYPPFFWGRHCPCILTWRRRQVQPPSKKGLSKFMRLLIQLACTSMHWLFHALHTHQFSWNAVMKGDWHVWIYSMLQYIFAMPTCSALLYLLLLSAFYCVAQYWLRLRWVGHACPSWFLNFFFLQRDYVGGTEGHMFVIAPPPGPPPPPQPSKAHASPPVPPPPPMQVLALGCS